MKNLCRVSLRCAVLAAAFACGCSRTTPPDVAPATEPTTAAREAFTPEEGFELLTLADFEPFPAEGSTWTEQQGVISTTGKPKGYLHSTKSFGDMIWRAEFRFVPAERESDPTKAEQSNTGFMLFIEGPHKVWPRSLEVQGKFIEMGQIKSNGGVPAVTIADDIAARERLRKSVGEWNAVEIECRGGRGHRPSER